MWATASPTADPPGQAAAGQAGPGQAGPGQAVAGQVGRPRRLFVLWLVTCLASLVAMPLYNGFETLPFHIALVVFVTLYGFGMSEVTWTMPSLVVFWGLSTAQFVVSAQAGAINWIETTELPLLAILVGAVVRHIGRREDALEQLQAMAERQQSVADSRDRLTRVTSHELRTPLTIARGYLELLTTDEPEGQRRTDLMVIDDELNRLGRVGDRLVRAIQLEGGAPIQVVDLDGTLHEVMGRWAVIAERSWSVQPGVGHALMSPERLRAALDTLIENALRYTREGGSIRLFSEQAPGVVRFGVADSGPGLSPDQLEAINAWQTHPATGLSAPLMDDEFRDGYSQTGLGLAMVHALARARGGRLIAGRSVEGGAQMTVEVPARAAAAPDLVLPTVSAQPPVTVVPTVVVAPAHQVPPGWNLPAGLPARQDGLSA